MFLNLTTGGENMKTVSALKEIKGEERRAWRGEGNTEVMNGIVTSYQCLSRRR